MLSRHGPTHGRRRSMDTQCCLDAKNNSRKLPSGRVVAVVGVDRGRVICGFLCGLAEVLTLGLSVSVCVLVAW